MLAGFVEGFVMKDSQLSGTSLGHALRHNLFNKITPILLTSDFIGDTATRELIRSNCLDMVALIEKLISEFGLDHGVANQDQVIRG